MSFVSDLYIAGKYARALFESAGVDERAEIGGALESLWRLLSDDEIYVKLVLSKASPKVMKSIVLNTVLGGSEICTLLRSFVKLLLENNRLYLLGKIQDEYKKLMLKGQNFVSVTFITVTKVSEEDLKALNTVLQECGINPYIINLEDATLLSGFLLKIGNNLLDCSLDRALNDIHKFIKNYDIGAK
ncbi:ATP synthase subunit delta [Candidatus Cyrtobacter comes]|uniref:ATP synthase subunit delta n=1 Tax=Candidatus Cyrtobacter comes TaxID=675776 RepID=A0ABU5L7Q8_9RICK|nr:ATP synthase F1 subunit delta [Candidatus Cyrtobacter comes]MDZ5761905.1 ATP synthase subunit delta [Candidatus Cyrtobacter comes]